jgi:hypothetical protein
LRRQVDDPLCDYQRGFVFVVHKAELMEHRMLSDCEPRYFIRAEYDTLFPKHARDCASFPASVELRDCSRQPMLQLVTVGKRQPPALSGQEVGLEIIVGGTISLLACLPSAFVTVDNLSSEVLEHACSPQR